MNKIKDMEDYYYVVENKKKVIVYWYTSKCPDCFIAKRFMPKIAKEFTDYEFYAIDKNSNLDLAKHLDILGVPSFQIFHKNDEIGRFVNKNRKTYIEVREFILTTINK